MRDYVDLGCDYGCSARRIDNDVSGFIAIRNGSEMSMRSSDSSRERKGNRFTLVSHTAHLPSKICFLPGKVAEYCVKDGRGNPRTSEKGVDTLPRGMGSSGENKTRSGIRGVFPTFLFIILH